jgi:hypothetical protein
LYTGEVEPNNGSRHTHMQARRVVAYLASMTGESSKHEAGAFLLE